MAKEEQIEQWVALLQGGQVSRRGFISGLAVLGVSASTIGVLLEACGATTTSSTTSGQPKRGGTLIIGSPAELSALDPPTPPRVTHAPFLRRVYNRPPKFSPHF